MNARPTRDTPSRRLLAKVSTVLYIAKVTQPLSDLGTVIREQREGTARSLRKLAENAGISTPYLSQIERGLRMPSAEILKSIARALSIRAEALFERAGLLEGVGEIATVREAIESDAELTPGQKQALMQIYTSFVSESLQEEQ